MGKSPAPSKLATEAILWTSAQERTDATLLQFPLVLVRSGAIDVLLDNGNVGIYVDLLTVNVHAGQYLRAGAKVGTIEGGSGEAAIGPSDLHLILSESTPTVRKGQVRSRE